MKESIVYVDGFNLYYGTLKNTKYKWLNIELLCQNLLKQNRILKIKYFTARASARPNDPQLTYPEFSGDKKKLKLPIDFSSNLPQTHRDCNSLRMSEVFCDYRNLQDR